MKRIDIKSVLLFLSFLYLILYIPLTATIYSKEWYLYNYETENVYKTIDKELAINSTENLISYFLHKENLNNNFNEKEKLHFEDVRNIYDILFLFFIFSIIIFILFYDKEKLIKYSKTNVILIICLSLIIPFFIYFWDNIFHIILFNNNYWITYENEISYYLFPISFFKNSFIFILTISILENIIIYFFAKRILK